VRRYATLALFLIVPTAAHAAMAYRVTVVTKGRFKKPPLVGEVIADGEKRRLTYKDQPEPFSEDVLLSTDGGKTVTALNTSLRTWFALTRGGTSETEFLSSIRRVQIKDTNVAVTEEPSEPIAGYPVRKFVIHAGYTTVEDYSGTKVKRIHSLTELVWTTDKLDGSLTFPRPAYTIGARPVDDELGVKTASISGFVLRDVETISRAYEGGMPTLEMTTTEVDEIRTVPSPPASQFEKPAGYVNQPPIISGAPTVISH
jgi:hypothetical protein